MKRDSACGKTLEYIKAHSSRRSTETLSIDRTGDKRMLSLDFRRVKASCLAGLRHVEMLARSAFVRIRPAFCCREK
jgi:hypothetical protein